MNYGETLAYWYLRLNGFFLIQDFILHENATGGPRPSDIDFLGVRFPYVYEPVGGGQPSDWDERLMTVTDRKLLSSPVAVIAEVKSGDVRCEEVEHAFSESRLGLALQRFGIWPETKELAQRLYKQCSLKEREWMILKIAFLADAVSSPLFHAITLDHVVCFIKQRLRCYESKKYAHRLFFNNALMEYLVWDVRQSYRNKGSRRG